MADQQLNIKLNVIDNASKAFTSVKNSIFNVRNALLGLGAGVAINSLINIGKEAEGVSSRLNQLAKAGYGGSQAFDQLTRFAISARIPLLDVFQASNDLLSVSKSPEELAKNLEIASNASAFFKISFTEASDQVAKSLLKGVDSARLFQDRGIKSLKGFGEFADKSFDGVGRSLERNFGANGIFGKANQELKEGLTGTLVALDNRFKQFQITVAQSFFDSLSRELGDLEVFLNKNNQAITSFATQLGSVLGKAVVIIGDGIVFFRENLETLILAFQIFISLKVASIFYDIAKSVGALTVALNVLSVSSGYGLLLKLITVAFTGVGTFIALSKVIDSTGEQTSNLNEELIGTSQLLDSIPKTFRDIYKYAKQANDEQISFSNILSNIAQKNIDSISNLKKEFSSLESISKVLVDGLDKGIKAFSRGLAESIVLGKGLEDTFRKFAQETLINLVSTVAELIIRTYILKSILEALGLPVDKANESSKNLRGTSLDIFGINSANYGVQVLTTVELEKQLAILKAQASVPRNSGGGMNFGGGGFGGGEDGKFGSTVGQAVGTYYGGPVGGAIGSFLGSFLPFAEGGQIDAMQPAIVGERGRELFIPSTNGTIVPTQDLNGKGTVVNINVSSVDVKGVEELFLNNRATITNIVNQALNTKGRSNLI